MSWVETWLDRATAPSIESCQAAAQQAGARGFNAYLGGRFSFLNGGGWTPAVTSALSAAGFGIFGTWVSLRPGEGNYGIGHQDGIDAISAANAHPAIGLVCYDVEPRTWNANPSGVTQAMAGFRDAVKASGRPVMIYGLQATLRAATDYDRYWGTFDLGSSDPATSAGSVGNRSVQFSQSVYAGLDWDVSHSEFSLLAGKGGPDEMAVILAHGDNDAVDPHGPGAIYVVDNWPFGPKRWIPDSTALAAYQSILGNVQVVNQFVLDRCEELPSESGYLSWNPSDVMTKVDQMYTLISNLASGSVVDQTKVLNAIAALKSDLDSLTLKKT